MMISMQTFGWTEIGWITVIGFLLVFVLLVLLIYVLKGFSLLFTTKKATPAAAAPAAKAKPQEDPHMVSEAKVAAIAIALSLYRGAMHDQESEVITIQAIKRAYSPWNSKIHSLTQLPERK